MKKLLLICLISFLGNSFLNAQSLVAGDIAFIGYITDGPDAFAFITLTDIPAGEVVYFTDKGWTGSAWIATTEDNLEWTAPGGGVPCGTIVTVTETSGDTFSITSGTGSIALSAGHTSFSMSAGDQIIAYRGDSGVHPVSPNFIAAVHGDYNSLDYNAGTTWNNGGTLNVTSSAVPTGLTNGVDCVSLYPGVSELDDNRYTGTLTGTADVLRTAINTPGNWTVGTNTAGIVTVNPGDFPVPNVDCTVLNTNDFSILNQLSNIYPNPNKGNFTLNYSGQEQLKELQVLDMLGKRIQTISLENFANSKEINLTTLAKGMYFITIQSETTSVTKRMIIE